MIAVLFVQNDSVYRKYPDTELWTWGKDARSYDGPWPVIAHPPCQRWGRFWHGCPIKPHQFQKGADDGCFAAAIAAVRQWGGVLEHPAQSHAWEAHRMPRPPRKGWQRDIDGGWSCYVEQGHYGHMANKPTWLYAFGIKEPPELIWGRGEQRLHPVILARHGYEKARRTGMAATIGGKDKTKLREATPEPFAELLLSIAGKATNSQGQSNGR